jgi:hypothetical protein
MHHHGADGSCHPGPGGMFRCVLCERDLDDEDPPEGGQEAGPARGTPSGLQGSPAPGSG